jgi:AcrR family transcriptional regulator
MAFEQNRREGIILAAQKLFSQFGPRKTSVDEIARLAQVSKGTIYNYFKSKEEIYSAVVQQELTSLIEQIKEAVAKENDSIGKMRAYLLTKISRVRELVNFYQVTREAAVEYWPLIKGIKRKYLKAERSILVDILTEGNKRGELVVPEPELFAQIIAASTSGMEAPWLLSELSISQEEFVDAVVEAFFKGIARRSVKRVNPVSGTTAQSRS